MKVGNTIWSVLVTTDTVTSAANAFTGHGCQLCFFVTCLNITCCLSVLLRFLLLYSVCHPGNGKPMVFFIPTNRVWHMYQWIGVRGPYGIAATEERFLVEV